jgi:hypothetical protein
LTYNSLHLGLYMLSVAARLSIWEKLTLSKLVKRIETLGVCRGMAAKPSTDFQHAASYSSREGGSVLVARLDIKSKGDEVRRRKTKTIEKGTRALIKQPAYGGGVS